MRPVVDRLDGARVHGRDRRRSPQNVGVVDEGPGRVVEADARGGRVGEDLPADQRVELPSAQTLHGRGTSLHEPGPEHVGRVGLGPFERLRDGGVEGAVLPRAREQEDDEAHQREPSPDEPAHPVTREAMHEVHATPSSCRERRTAPGRFSSQVFDTHGRPLNPSGVPWRRRSGPPAQASHDQGPSASRRYGAGGLCMRVRGSIVTSRRILIVVLACLAVVMPMQAGCGRRGRRRPPHGGAPGDRRTPSAASASPCDPLRSHRTTGRSCERGRAWRKRSWRATGPGWSVGRFGTSR